MKTLSVLLITSTLGGIAALSASAQPPAKRTLTQRPPSAEATAERRSEDQRSSAQGLTCETMLVPTTGGTKNSYRTVTCTPEMLARDRRCQQACDKS